jgi:hypothetical protein
LVLWLLKLLKSMFEGLQGRLCGFCVIWCHSLGGAVMLSQRGISM